MAWNVVIAGGGFGGAMAARELERIDAAAVGAADARQRRQLPALHAVPAGGGGGDAGAAPRGHAAARDARPHLPAAGHGHGPRPERAHGRAADPRGRDRASFPTTSCCSRSARSRGCCRCPGLAEHAIGFKTPRRRDLAAQPRDRDARGGERHRGPGAPRRAAHLRLRRRRLRRPRGARRAAGLRRRRDRALPARPPARDALGAGRGARPRAARDRRRRSPTTRCASCAAAASTSALGDDAGGGRAPTAPGSRPARRCRPGRWSGPPASRRTRACARLGAAARRARAASPSTTTCACGAWSASGRSATAPRRPTRAAALCPPTAQHAVRQGRVAARNIAAELGVGTARPFEYRGNAAFVNLGRYKAVGRVGGRTFRGFPAWWMARTYHMSQIPGAARKARAVIDWTVSLPFRRDLAEVGSIGHPRRLGETRQWSRGIRVPRHRLLLRAGHGDHRPRQGQLVLALAADRHRAAAARPDRGRPLPLREGRTRTPVPHLPQAGEALRPGLPPLRHGSLPARSRRSPPSGSAGRGGPSHGSSWTDATKLQGNPAARRLPGEGPPLPIAARCALSRWRTRGRSGPRPASSSGRGGAWRR